MASKTKTTVSSIDASPIYQEFEPFCEWKRGEDLLIVHIPEFKKEHLRVLVNTSRALKIIGERPLIGDKAATRSRFYKETTIPEECNINDVHAKLCDGKLTIAMPRKTPNSSTPYSASLDNSMQGKCDSGEEMIGFGSLKVAKKIAMNVGIAVAAIATIGVLVFFKPETSVSASSAALANRKE
ncbi:hypothetical protein V2J09_010173 [Rumex salicifolius]